MKWADIKRVPTAHEQRRLCVYGESDWSLGSQQQNMNIKRKFCFEIIDVCVHGSKNTMISYTTSTEDLERISTNRHDVRNATIVYRKQIKTFSTNDCEVYIRSHVNNSIDTQMWSFR